MRIINNSNLFPSFSARCKFGSTTIDSGSPLTSSAGMYKESSLHSEDTAGSALQTISS
jgi:hypothetical protein